MNARRARKRRHEQARYHQEQSALPAGQQDTRFRLGLIRRERDIALAKVSLELNASIGELMEAAHEQRQAIQKQYAEQLKVAAGHEKKKRISKDTGAEARRLGIAIPTLDELRRLGKEPAAS